MYVLKNGITGNLVRHSMYHSETLCLLSMSHAMFVLYDYFIGLLLPLICVSVTMALYRGTRHNKNIAWPYCLLGFYTIQFTDRCCRFCMHILFHDGIVHSYHCETTFWSAECIAECFTLQTIYSVAHLEVHTHAPAHRSR